MTAPTGSHRSGPQRGRTVAFFAGLALAWAAWSGHTEPLMIGFGAASCLAALWLALRMGVVDEEGEPTHVLLGLIGYLPWLVVEIVKSNLHVARVIWTPKMPIQPALLRAPASQRTDLGKAIYANSITLTPGTLSLDVRGEEILVHALTDEARRGLETGEMDRRCTRAEGAGGEGR